MSKKTIFVALSLLAAVFGILAVKNDGTFGDTFWSQLFWLSTGTIATTFFVNEVLERDLSTRRRKEDKFAFRTFTATTFCSILQVVKADSTLLNQLIISALEGDEKFAEVTKNACTTIAKVNTIEPRLYNANYLDIASHLRDLASRFIRLFSKDYREMIEHYQNLQELAKRWEYKDILSKGSLAYMNSLEATDKIRKELETQFSEEVAVVNGLLKDTATYLSSLAERVATGKGMPPI